MTETEFRFGHAVACAALVSLAACASGPPKTAASAAIASATEAINHARTDNALAAAPQFMGEAQQRLAQAQAAINDGDNKTAIRLADEAKADAELADAMAQTAKAENAARTVNSDIGTLQQTVPK